ncbi:hypothetical protein MMPV_000547 [Pyropia vietnamensis]
MSKRPANTDPMSGGGDGDDGSGSTAHGSGAGHGRRAKRAAVAPAASVAAANPTVGGAIPTGAVTPGDAGATAATAPRVRGGDDDDDDDGGGGGGGGGGDGGGDGNRTPPEVDLRLDTVAPVAAPVKKAERGSSWSGGGGHPSVADAAREALVAATDALQVASRAASAAAAAAQAAMAATSSAAAVVRAVERVAAAAAADDSAKARDTDIVDVPAAVTSGPTNPTSASTAAAEAAAAAAAAIATAAGMVVDGLITPPTPAAAAMARGDHLMVWRGRSSEDGLVGFWHSGIDVGDGSVIHYAGMDGVKTLANAVIAQTPMADFVGDARRVHVVCYAYEARAGRLYPPEEVVARALSRLGHKRYDLLYDNCESFARWAKTGREVSQQAQGALLGLVIGVGSVALGGGLFGGLLTAVVVHKFWDRSSNRSAERVAAYRPGPTAGGAYPGGGGFGGVPVSPVVLGPARRAGGVEAAAAAAAAAGAAARARVAATVAAGGGAGEGATAAGGVPGGSSPRALLGRPPRTAEPAPPLPMARLLSVAEGGTPTWTSGHDRSSRHRQEGADTFVPRGLE